MAIREIKQTFFSAETKKMMIKSHYLSLFVSATALQTEKDHIEGFAPEGHLLNMDRKKAIMMAMMEK